MSASLASATVQIEKPKAEARSSVEVHDSCNCFKFCFPCFGRKVKQKDPRSVRDSRTLEILKSATASEAIPSTSYATLVPHPEYNRITVVDLTERSSDRPVRSPASDALGDGQDPSTVYGTIEHDLTLQVTISESQMTLDKAKQIQAGQFK